MKSIQLYNEESIMEDNLNAVYKEWWPRLLQSLHNISHQNLEKLANPFLLKALPAYRKSKRKILFVGQETNGWDSLETTLKTFESQNIQGQYDTNIKYLQWMYEDLRFNRRWDHTNFWKGMRSLYQNLSKDTYDDGFLHTELVRVDLSGRRPPVGIEELIQKEFNVLPGEIQALEPEIVIFLTGPNYDERIRQTFNNNSTFNISIRFEEIESFTPNQLVRLVHPSLPFHTYRTYHPEYSLHWSPTQFNLIQQELSELIETSFI